LGPQGGLRAVGDADLREHLGQVCLDGLLADLQPTGDELVREALPDQREHLALAGAELDRGAHLRSLGDHLVRGARGQRRLAPGSGADAADDLVGVGVLEQVAERAGVECAENPVAVGERGQHHDPGRRPRRDQRTGDFDPVELGHLQVE
jgi:hypothetical protein